MFKLSAEAGEPRLEEWTLGTALAFSIVHTPMIRQSSQNTHIPSLFLGLFLRILLALTKKLSSPVSKPSLTLLSTSFLIPAFVRHIIRPNYKSRLTHISKLHRFSCFLSGFVDHGTCLLP